MELRGGESLPKAPVALRGSECTRTLVAAGSAAQWCPTLCDPMTVAHQAPLSMGFPRQEYWSGLPFPSPGDCSNQGWNPQLLLWQVDALPLIHQGSPASILTLKNKERYMEDIKPHLPGSPHVDHSLATYQPQSN